MSNIRDAAINFEGVKLKITQDKTGYILTLSIHPNQIPDELLRSWVGTRYMVAMVELNEQEEPVLSEAQEEGKRAVGRAGIICRDKTFWGFLSDNTNEPIFSMDDCRETLCRLLEIKSRAELKDNKRARDKFDHIYSLYNKYRDDFRT